MTGKTRLFYVPGPLSPFLSFWSFRACWRVPPLPSTAPPGALGVLRSASYGSRGGRSESGRKTTRREQGVRDLPLEGLPWLGPVGEGRREPAGSQRGDGGLEPAEGFRAEMPEA